MSRLMEEEVYRRLSWDQNLEDFAWCIQILEGPSRLRAIEYAMKQLEGRLDHLHGISVYVRSQLDASVYHEWVEECEAKIRLCLFHMGGGIDC